MRLNRLVNTARCCSRKPGSLAAICSSLAAVSSQNSLSSPYGIWMVSPVKRSSNGSGTAAPILGHTVARSHEQ